MTTATQPACLRRPILQPICARAWIARRVLAHVVGRVGVRVVLSDGTILGSVDEQAPTIEVVRPASLFERVAHHPKIGIGEAYMAGDWRPAPGQDLADVLLPFARRLSSAVPPSLQRFRAIVDRRIPASQRNTVSGSRDNIRAHYDLSNDLFAAFLDPTLTYSAALFDPTFPWAEQSLESAQLRKIHRVLDVAGVVEGSDVLEIGTGWGTLAIEAARRGARVTTVTLSVEQSALARQRARDAGLEHLVEVRVQDYREVSGSYGAIVSVEMIEAVGEEFWPDYFGALDRLLAPGGVVALQAILMSHDRYLATRSSFGWIQKYIFPGGLIPSLTAIEETTRAHTSLQVTSVTPFGLDYAETLRRWRSAFNQAWPEVNRLGFDETFRRMWEFYLAYSEAGFDSGYLDVAHLRLERVAA